MKPVFRIPVLFDGLMRALGVLSLTSVCALAAPSRYADYEYRIGSRQTLTHLHIPFEVPSSVKKVYASYIRALEIVRITVDGRDPKSVIGFTFHDELPSAHIEPGSKNYIYGLSIEEGISWCPSPQELGALRKSKYV
jgi:hypothetical protein